MLGLFATKKILTQNKRVVCTKFSWRIYAFSAEPKAKLLKKMMYLCGG